MWRMPLRYGKTDVREENCPVKNASVIWHELCDMGAIYEADFTESVNANNADQWIRLDPRSVHSHLHRFMDAQDFMADDDAVSLGA